MKNNSHKSDPFLKRLEYRLKNWIDTFLVREDSPISVNGTENIFGLTTDSRVLILRHDRIGDLIVSTPFFRIFRHFYPDICIDVLLSNKNVSAIRAIDSYVNNVFVFEKSIINQFLLLRKLKSNNYDIIIDLFDNPSTTSSFLIKLVNPLYAIGFDKTNRLSYSHLVNLPDKNKVHIVERISKMLSAFGVSPKSNELKLEFRISRIELERAFEKIHVSGKILGINLSGSSRAKFWGNENLISFITQFNMKHKDFSIVLFYTNDYDLEAEEIIQKTIAVKSPKSSSFVQFASYIATCDYLLTPDTSVVHLASAFNIPCVSLHLYTGSTDTGLPWYAFNSPTKYLVTNTDKLSNIEVEKVLSAFEELINDKK